MKMNRKMRLVKEVADMLVSEGKEATRDTVSSRIVGKTQGVDPMFEAKYGSIRTSDISTYFREFNGTVA